MNRIDHAPLRREPPTEFPGSVAIVAWPAEAERAAELARQVTPRLLLVAPGSEPPVDWDSRTDWVRLPADERDLCARVAALQRQASTLPPPTLDEFDVLWRGPRWTALAPIEARLLRVLLDRCGSVVTQRELRAAAWPDCVPSSRAVDARLKRLRDRVHVVGLEIHNVRRRGLLLEVHDPPTADVFSVSSASSASSA